MANVDICGGHRELGWCIHFDYFLKYSKPFSNSYFFFSRSTNKQCSATFWGWVLTGDDSRRLHDSVQVLIKETYIVL